MSFFKKLGKDIKRSVKTQKEKRDLVRDLTIPELKKIFKAYVSDELKIRKYDKPSGKIKSVKPNRKDLERRILLNVSKNNILNSVPRLKKSKSKK